MRNQIRTSVRLTRGEICDLLIACLSCYNKTNSTKWDKLHDKLKIQLQELDDDLDKFYDEITR